MGEKEYLSYAPSFVLLTHLHPDHAYFINEKASFDFPMLVFAPEPWQESNIRVISDPFVQNGYKITPIPTIHSTRVKSQGYLIEKGNCRLFYTGDMISIPSSYHRFLTGLDAVITEASYFRRGGMVRKNSDGRLFGHTGVPDLVDFFRKYTKHLIFTHFGSWFVKDPTAGKKKISGLADDSLTLDVAADGKEFMI
ncbi:hypothetical protein HF324_01775 [Chitinophaga oryzae]|uniref:Metallo-beta-lactamase domain-containing protein n=2 Tax=Chitinophaga oryzae TaxID=2725414 RepID=A0AAE6ZDR3_9BACT|nr:MBL fold metallo-hydrolase [Chitinophaga oryzae]QJB30160.1 hypothetical protein HF329_02065 [Chitinophaga oryzae]QJB36658.1 hypothetical protein HF324_01775 [Chitinophaga oryzae]